MQGKWVDRKDCGSCNFCSDTYNEKYRKVFEFKGDEHCNLQVRMCRKCLKKLKEISK